MSVAWGVHEDQRLAGAVFSGELDRAAFNIYFLGAVVPLIGFGLVVDRFALPPLNDHETRSR